MKKFLTCRVLGSWGGVGNCIDALVAGQGWLTKQKKDTEQLAQHLFNNDWDVGCNLGLLEPANLVEVAHQHSWVGIDHVIGRDRTVAGQEVHVRNR